VTGEQFSEQELHTLRAIPDGRFPNFAYLRRRFAIWKNDALSATTEYGTWEMNSDPRDHSANVEVAFMGMSGATTQNFGAYPYTIAAAWMHAALIARVCALKNIDCNGSFDVSVEPAVLQNGPIYNVSTHGERALQTYNPPPNGATNDALGRSLGYFLGSGDPDSRWDIGVTDAAYLPVTPASARAAAAWLRAKAHAIKVAGLTDYWGLDGGETP
jgi:hypothetical protein